MNPKSKKDKYTVQCTNQHQTIKVLNYINNDNDTNWSYWRYVTRLGDNDSDINNSIIQSIKQYPIISFKEWESLPDSEFILPEKWCIKYNGEPEIEDYVFSKKEFNHDYEVRLNEWVISEPGVDGSYQEWYELNAPNGYTEIDFNQFKEHVFGKENINKLNSILTDISDNVKEKLKEQKIGVVESIQPSIEACNEFSDISNNIKVEDNDEISGSLIEYKKIIGYKLIKPEYKEACNSIAGNFIESNFYLENLTGPESIPKEKLSKSGVLDLWFEPVYESSIEEKIIDYLAKKGITIGNLYAEDIVRLVNEK